MQPSLVLQAVIELLEQGHCVGAYARGRDGRETPYWLTEDTLRGNQRMLKASSWSIRGAIERVTDGNSKSIHALFPPTTEHINDLGKDQALTLVREVLSNVRSE